MHAFFKNLVNPPERWLCLFAYENERLVGILPLVSSYAFRIFGFFLHLFKLPYHVAHTGGTDCLTLPGREDILDLFLDYLNRIPRTLPLLSLKHVPEHYPSVNYFAQKKHKMCAAKVPGGFETFIPLPKSSDECFSGLSQNARKNLNRRSRELEKIPGWLDTAGRNLPSLSRKTVSLRFDLNGSGSGAHHYRRYESSPEARLLAKPIAVDQGFNLSSNVGLPSRWVIRPFSTSRVWPLSVT